MIKKKSKILILGASGFVGSALARALKNSGEEIFLVSRNRNFKIPGHKTYYGDIGNYYFCKKILKGKQIIYYLAGYNKNLSLHLQKPYDFFKGNVGHLLVFLDALKTAKIKKMIYLSSVNAAYADALGDKIDGYVSGKYASELAIRSFVQEFGTDISIIRSAPIYGPGDNFDPEVAKFIPAIIKKVFENDKKIIVWGGGIRKCQFIYIDDLVENLIAAQKAKEKKFVFGNNEVATVGQVVKMIIKISSKKLAIKFDRAKPDKRSKLNKYMNLVEPRHSLKLGLLQTIDYFKKVGL